ncbi:MAG: histidine kinase [Candidatus Accumulibacter sp.]|nr:histidine kinase [Accumulibacter sp.]
MISARPLRWIDLLTLVAGYVALDWASYFHPLHEFNFTPWNPAPALGLVYVLRHGWKAVPPLMLAVLIADAWVRSLPAPLPEAAVLAVLLGGAYGAIGGLLRRHLGDVEIFSDRRGMLAWSGIVVAGTLLSSLIIVLAFVVAGLIAPGEWREGVGRYWIGDGVGILVSMPVLWMLLDERGRALLASRMRGPGAVVLLAAIGAALWIAFGRDTPDFKYFYVLFLPIVWAAARQGLAGAVFAAAVMQVGIIAAVQLLGFPAVSVFEVQTLVVVLALLGFFVGVVVDEQQRISAELRQTLRLAAAGEMAGALAHELNQPLTALSAYGTACEHMIAQGETGERLRDAIRRMVAESFRAAEVVRRLRDFFRTGSTQLERVAVDDLLDAAAASFQTGAARSGAVLRVAPAPADLPPGHILGDRLQLEVLLRNLLGNAADAVAGQPEGRREIRLAAAPEGAGRICIRVEDSGPGLSGETALRVFEPFHSTKTSGMGLGLAISRAIAEAHGGHLLAEVADHGVFKLILPIEPDQ